LIGLTNHPSTGYGPALRLLERYADRYPFEEMVTHEFGLDDVETAMRTSMSHDSMKVPIVPNGRKGRVRRWRKNEKCLCILLVVSVLNLVIANYLTHHPELTDGRGTDGRGYHAIKSASVITVLAAALVISLCFPTFGVLSLLLLFPAQAITARWAARTSQVSTKP
jgi:hypothetical protein